MTEDDEAEVQTLDTSRIISVLAETNRRDRWTIAAQTSMVTFLARSYFDFRKVETTAEEVRINLICAFGDIIIVVPEGTNVQLSGFSFLASVNSNVASPNEAGSHLPRIVLNANTVFGRIIVRTPNDIELGLAPLAPKASDAATVVDEIGSTNATESEDQPTSVSPSSSNAAAAVAPPAAEQPTDDSVPATAAESEPTPVGSSA